MSSSYSGPKDKQAVTFSANPHTVAGRNAIEREGGLLGHNIIPVAYGGKPGEHLPVKPKPKPKPQDKPKNEDKPQAKAKTIQEAQDYAKKNLGFDYVNYRGLDVEVANHFNDTIAKIQTRFPELKGTVGEIQPIPKGNAIAAMSVFTSLPSDGVPLQILHHGKGYKYGLKRLEEINKMDIESGFHPKGTESVSSHIWHEYGHAYANLQSGKKIATKEPKDWRRRHDDFDSDRTTHNLEREWIEKAAKSQNMTASDFKASISRYATRDDGEAFAEAFSEFFVSPNPRPECTALMKAAGII